MGSYKLAMMNRISTISVLILSGIMLFHLTACASGIIEEAVVQEWNRELKTRVFIVKEDLYPGFTGAGKSKSAPIFKKGEKVRIWEESSDEWIRVKAYKTTANREQATGKTIIYLFQGDFREDEDPVQRINDEIMKFLDTEDGQPLQTAGSPGR